MEKFHWDRHTLERQPAEDIEYFVRIISLENQRNEIEQNQNN